MTFPPASTAFEVKRQAAFARDQRRQSGGEAPQGAKLEEDLQQIRAARSRGPGSADVEDRVREERLNEKGALINKLQEELGVEMSRMEQGGILDWILYYFSVATASFN